MTNYAVLLSFLHQGVFSEVVGGSGGSHRATARQRPDSKKTKQTGRDENYRPKDFNSERGYEKG